MKTKIYDEERLLIQLKKDLSRDFKVDFISAFKERDGSDLKNSIAISFYIDITNCNGPQDVADEVFKFWNNLRNHINLEIER